jgi:hypothetical protein
MQFRSQMLNICTQLALKLFDSLKNKYKIALRKRFTVSQSSFRNKSLLYLFDKIKFRGILPEII